MYTQSKVFHSSLEKVLPSIRLLFIISGFVPVSCIALNVFHFMPLHESALYMALPCCLFIFIFSFKFSTIGKKALKGWISGIIAVSLYDLARIPFILSGWEDFIPRIGDWLLQTESTSPFIGYLWRYIGNGGGMGIAFFLLLERSPSLRINVLKGLVYGLFVFSSLMLVLIFSRDGQILMFKITPFTFTGSLLGHIVYGLILGLASHFPRERISF